MGQYKLSDLKRKASSTADHWVDTVPIYTIDISLLELAARRPKNGPDYIKEASRRIEAMKDWEADAGSAHFLDRLGNPLLSVFSWGFGSAKGSRREKPQKPASLAERVQTEPRNPYPGSHGRTLKDLVGQERFHGLGVSHAWDISASHSNNTVLGQYAMELFDQTSKYVPLRKSCS